MSVKGKVHFSFSVWPYNFKQHMWGGCLLDSRGEVNRNNKDEILLPESEQ